MLMGNSVRTKSAPSSEHVPSRSVHFLTLSAHVRFPHFGIEQVFFSSCKQMCSAARVHLSGCYHLARRCSMLCGVEQVLSFGKQLITWTFPKVLELSVPRTGAPLRQIDGSRL